MPPMVGSQCGSDQGPAGSRAVVGVPDDNSGEAVKLFVVKKDENLTIDELKAHCAANLTNYKRPRYIEFRTELPKTNVGKILRRALKEEMQKTPS